MDIQKLAEEIGKQNGLDIRNILDSALAYLGLARNAFHDLLGHGPGEGKVYDLAIVALFVTTPILLIKPLIRFAVKLIALSAVSALIIGRIYPLPVEQMITASVMMGFGLYVIIKVFRK